jgi:hypothetical protein
MVLAYLASRLFALFPIETGSWTGGGARILRVTKLKFITSNYVNSIQFDLQPAEFIQCSNNNQTRRDQEKKKDNGVCSG